jgi:hypothetical protein
MRILNADLLTAQQYGYPIPSGKVFGGYKPALRCIFFSEGEVISYEYSFNPLVNTNLLIYAEQREHISENDGGSILIQNSDNTVPDNLVGYHVDLGWGHLTSSGLQWDEAAGAVAPRMWVMSQMSFYGGNKNDVKQRYTVLGLSGVISGILKQQLVRINTSPIFRVDEENPFAALTDKTIYEIIEYLIETALKAQVGMNFTLDALGTQDDGLINSIVPFPDGGDYLRVINAESPAKFQTYFDVISSLLEMTNCVMIASSTLVFKIIYPQTDDEVQKTYHVSPVDGHPFYQVRDSVLNAIPNHVEVFGGEDENTGLPTYVGDWFDPDVFPTPPSRPFTPADIKNAYTGQFTPVTHSLWETSYDTDQRCIDRAEVEGKKIIDSKEGSIIVIPMDAGVELYDRIEVQE